MCVCGGGGGAKRCPMDQENFSALRVIAPAQYKERLHLFLTFSQAKKGPKEVPDPYYGGGFEAVYEMLYTACSEFISQHVISAQ